jgi:transcriptional regulator with XRE-family HTH domain
MVFQCWGRLAWSTLSSPLKRERPHLGESVRFFREYAGLTQEEVADKGDIHVTWISHVERGKVNPTYKTMEKIATGIGVSHDHILDLAEALAEIPKR